MIRILLLGTIAILGQHYLVWVDVNSLSAPEDEANGIAIYFGLHRSYVSCTGPFDRKHTDGQVS
jgi:hypothetical protein